MLQGQCISVTDLRTKTKECLEDLSDQPKYIFVNNRPIAVLIDIKEYEEHFLKPQLKELEINEVNEDLKSQAEAALRSKKSDLIDIH